MMEELKAMDMDVDPEGALQIFLYYMQVRENSYMSIESGLAKRPLLEKGQLEVPDGMGYAGVMLDCIEGMQSEEGKYLSKKNKIKANKKRPYQIDFTQFSKTFLLVSHILPDNHKIPDK